MLSSIHHLQSTKKFPKLESYPSLRSPFIMVSIKAIYTALVLPVLMVTAAPVDDLPIAKDGTDISPLAVKASITYCEHTNWNGQCETRLQPLTECCKANLPPFPFLLPLPLDWH